MEWEVFVEEEYFVIWLFWVLMVVFLKCGWLFIIVDEDVVVVGVLSWWVFCVVFENGINEEVLYEDLERMLLIVNFCVLFIVW